MGFNNSYLAAYLRFFYHFSLMLVARRYHLRKDEIQKLSGELGSELQGVKRLLTRGNVEALELTDGRRVISAGGKPVLLLLEKPVPLLSIVHSVRLKRVVVDMGAVPYVARGADIMAPGVVSADKDIEPGATVAVVDERHEKPLAVGLAEVRGCEMKGPSGRVVKNLHHVGDKIWGLFGKTGRAV
jgi:PUA domain protein